MNHIVWDKSYEMGVDFLDKEHKLLFSRMDKLLKLSETEEKSEWACREGVKYLKNHAVEHFEHEEAYMLSIRYSDFELHRHLHDDFRHRILPALEAELERNGYSMEAVRHFVGVCIGWVIAHTKTEDLAIVGKEDLKWKDLPQEEEREALKTTITRLVQELFHLSAKTVSEQYAGEDFGKMVCNRFLYRRNQKEKWEVTLVFEEKLLLKVIGEILNEKFKRVDDMVLNVNRYIARQFLEKVREYFPKLNQLELEKESLLTHEQLAKSFERTRPAYSLLFDTREGYFAFCASSGDYIQDAVVSIDHANVLDTIREYLVMEDEEEARRKPKILVVDDSDFMRTRIVRLLAQDYDVIEADSSIAAIKKIVVNQPGLVLLDYEMPVCDGRQALEMIRSEKDIADIPVMFLTGRGDRESVKNVMALKPAGYLLKTMTDDVIKGVIDQFFEKENG